MRKVESKRSAARTVVAPAGGLRTHFDFSGRRALVTGATSGIGRGVALALVEAGAAVVAIGRNPRALAELSGCTLLALDLADVPTLEAALAPLAAFDLVVNCAGISICEPGVELQAASFDATMAVNARAAALVAARCGRAMVRSGVRGSIVNVSSQAAGVGLDGHLAYGASKAALDAVTRNLCLELGRHGIRVNSLNPTVTLTPMAARAWSDPARSAGALARIPLGRFASIEDVVAPVLFLLSDAAAMISGVSLAVDGGYTAV